MSRSGRRRCVWARISSCTSRLRCPRCNRCAGDEELDEPRAAAYDARSHSTPLLTLSWQDAENVEGILLDVSESGMDVLISKPVPNFTDLTFRFSLPQRLAPVEGRGVVAWSRSTGESGVRFETLSEDAHIALNSWLDSSVPAVSEHDATSVILCKLTDLSLGACYVESESPFP